MIESEDIQQSELVRKVSSLFLQISLLMKGLGLRVITTGISLNLIGL